MSDFLLIKQRNKMMVAMIWLLLLTDLTINLLSRDFLIVQWVSISAVPLLLLITYFIRKNILPNLTMYIISVCFITVLIILNSKDESYINLFFLILPPIFSVTYRDWKNILFTTILSAVGFCYFLLTNVKNYNSQWKTSDIYYFLFFFLAFAILNVFETRFSEGIRNKLIDELNRVKMLQNKLHDNEERYKAMVKQSSEGIYAFNPKSMRIVETNERFCELLGYEEHELLKLSLNDFTVSAESVIDQNIHNILKSHRYFVGERMYRCKNGKLITVEMSATAIRLKDDTVILTTIRDITKQKEAEALIQKQEKLLYGAAEALNCLLTNGEHTTAIREALKIIGSAVQVDRVYIFENHYLDSEFSMSQRYVWVKASNSVQLNNPPLQNIPYLQGGFSRWHKALSSGKTIQGPVNTFPLCEQQFLETYDVKALLVVPIFILDEFWGFIGFDDCENERYWNKREEMILLTAAAGIGGAISQNRAANQLLESESKYRLIADNMSDYVTVLDRDGKILYASPSHQKVMKINLAEFRGSYFHDSIHPDDKEAFHRAFHNMLYQRIILKLDVRWRFRERWINLALRGKPVVENNEIQKVVIVARNITNRIKMEEKIRRTSARLETLISNIPYGILAEDKKNRLILINQQFREIFSIPTSLKELAPDEIQEKGRNFFVEEDLYIKRNEEILKKREQVLDEIWELKDGRMISRDAIPIFINDQYDGFLWQFKDITEQKRLEQKFKEASLLDGLTNIPNRRFLDETIAKEWGRCARGSKPLTVIMADIDYFKNYNDTYGHQVGDECLIRVAHTIKENLHRPFDAVCRYGGEEFVVILPETNQEGGLKIAEKICSAIEALEIPHASSSVTKFVTCSFGTATVIPSPFIKPEELIRRADRALYISKTNGRNQVNFYGNKKIS